MRLFIRLCLFLISAAGCIAQSSPTGPELDSMAHRFLGTICTPDPDRVLPDQDSLGRRFLGAIFSGEDSSAWEMVAARARDSMSYKAFAYIGSRARIAGAPFGPGFKRVAVGVNYTSPNTPNGYYQAYRFGRDSNTPPCYILSVLYTDCYSTHIDGFSMQTNGLDSDGKARGITLAGDEKVAVEGVGNWSVDGRQLWIDGISLIHTSDAKAIMVIRAWQKLANGPDVKERARAAAIPIVRHAVEAGMLERAAGLARDDNRTLEERIGVTFIVTEQGVGYRVYVSPEQYDRVGR